MENENFKALINKAKSNNQNKTLQKVIPVTVKKNKEKQFSFFLDEELLKKIKLMGLNNNKSIKEIIIEALENHLKSN